MLTLMLTLRTCLNTAINQEARRERGHECLLLKKSSQRSDERHVDGVEGRRTLKQLLLVTELDPGHQRQNPRTQREAVCFFFIHFFLLFLSEEREARAHHAEGFFFRRASL